LEVFNFSNHFFTFFFIVFLWIICNPMEIDSKEILKKTKLSLVKMAKDIDTVQIEPFLNFELPASGFRTMINCNASLAFLNKQDTPVIYTIELVNNRMLAKLMEAFSLFSTVNKSKTKNEDRVNNSKHNERISETLYVGSSMENFKSRLKDHLGVKKGLRTYGLHLSKWDAEIDYSIRVKVYKVKLSSGNQIERNIVELIEQEFWDQLLPVFGKRSGLL